MLRKTLVLGSLLLLGACQEKAEVRLEVNAKAIPKPIIAKDLCRGKLGIGDAVFAFEHPAGRFIEIGIGDARYGLVCAPSMKDPTTVEIRLLKIETVLDQGESIDEVLHVDGLLDGRQSILFGRQMRISEIAYQQGAYDGPRDPLSNCVEVSEPRPIRVCALNLERLTGQAKP